MAPTPPPTYEARVRARRQFRRVFLILAIVDLIVLTVVGGLGAVWGHSFPFPSFVALLVSAASGLVLLHIAVGARLQRRARG